MPTDSQTSAEVLARVDKIEREAEFSSHPHAFDIAWLCARLREALTDREWRDIETAPKDDEILVTDGTTVAVGWWENELMDAESGRHMPGEWIAMASIDDAITHWMKLPEPPNAD